MWLKKYSTISEASNFGGLRKPKINFWLDSSLEIMVHYTKTRRSNFLQKMTNKITKFRGIIFSFLIIFSLAYFWQVTSLSMKGFQIKDLDKQIQQLKKDSQKLELELTVEKSMMNVDERVKGLNLVAVKNVEYLNIVSPSVALR
ncbi:MAG TPA: hypothetical protein DEB73_00095 [Candidatus Magasanikbacteria bacterium]|nr:hypothetical protein [Candidatus Magasanikbacteria bacterium]HBX16174.1 hypothetical protein [Candidatus Magasanikbacteria bacterium]